MTINQKTNTATPLPEEEKPEITGVHTITRGSVQRWLAQPEYDVPFYDESNFPQELQLPEKLKDNALVVEVHQQAKRILCGQESNISRRDFDYAKQFIEILIAPSALDAEDIRRHQTFEALVNTELTDWLNEQLAFGWPKSVLDQERETLGINTKEMEKPFEIKVLEVEGPGHSKRMEKWMEITKAPDMFVHEDPSGAFIIYVPADGARLILNPESKDTMRADDIRKLRHEYRHTQRDVVMGKDQALFRLIDEPLADIIGYKYLTVFLNLLTKTTDTIRLRELYDAYESGDNEHMADCFSRMADAIGAKGLLLLGGKNSSDCSSEEDGIKDLPLDEGNFGSNEWLQLTETILALRQEKDADWPIKLASHLQSNQISLQQLEVTHLLFILQFKRQGVKDDARLVDDGLQSHDAHLTGVLLEVLKAEIEKRRALGEEGLYKKTV